MVVGTYDDGRNYIKAGEIALSINDTTGESTALINANHVNISSTTTAHLLSGSIKYDENGNLVLKETSGAGIIVEHNRQGDTASFGIWDKGDLTGGVMVQQINGQTGTVLTLDADVINIQGIVNELTSYDVVTGTLKTNNTFEADGEATFHDGADFDSSDVTGIVNLSADYITTDDITCDGDIKITDSNATLDVYGIDARDIVAKSLTLRSSQGGKLTCNDVDCSDIDCSAIDCTAVDASSWIEAASYWISGVNHAATWQDATYYTYDRTNSHKFYYEDTVGTSTVTGYLNGQLITAATSHTIHYLGY